MHSLLKNFQKLFEQIEFKPEFEIYDFKKYLKLYELIARFPSKIAGFLFECYMKMFLEDFLGFVKFPDNPQATYDLIIGGVPFQLKYLNKPIYNQQISYELTKAHEKSRLFIREFRNYLSKFISEYIKLFKEDLNQILRFDIPNLIDISTEFVENFKSMCNEIYDYFTQNFLICSVISEKQYNTIYVLYVPDKYLQTKLEPSFSFINDLTVSDFYLFYDSDRFKICAGEYKSPNYVVFWPAFAKKTKTLESGTIGINFYYNNNQIFNISGEGLLRFNINFIYDDVDEIDDIDTAIENFINAIEKKSRKPASFKIEAKFTNTPEDVVQILKVLLDYAEEILEKL